MPLSRVQQCIKQHEFYIMRTQLYCLTASYKQNLDSSMFWLACYYKYAKKLGLEKMLVGAIQNLQYCTHMKYTINTSFFLLHQCILTRLQFYYGTRYFNTTNCFIIYSVLYNVRACIVDWYHVYVLCSSQWFYKMNHWVLISDRGGHFCLLVGSPPQPLCADLLTEPPLPANLLSLGTLFWMW